MDCSNQITLSSTISWSLVKFTFIESVILSNHLILYFPFPLCPQSFPATGFFLMSWFFISGGQSVRASASASLLPMNIQGWFPGLAGLISLQSIGLSIVFQCHSLKACIFHLSAFFMVQHSHAYMTTGKTMLGLYGLLLAKWCLCFSLCSLFVIAFLPRRKHLLISWLLSPSALILEPKKIKSVTASTFSPSICHEVMVPDTMIFLFLMLSFKPALSLFSFTLIKRLFSSSSLLAIRLVLSAYLRLLKFLLAILIPVCDSYSIAFLLRYLCIS